MANSDSSSVEEYEEDSNVPTDVNCGRISTEENEDEGSVSSELSDQSMRHYGLTYDCKPDISEVANLTLNVNYGDLANMACERIITKQPSLVLGPVNSALEECGALTWSELLDGEVQQPQTATEHSTISYIWTQGYDDTSTLAGATLAPFSRPYKLTRRPSDFSARSLSSWSSRPRPLDSIKRFLARRKERSTHDKQSSSRTAETTKSTLRV